MHGYGSGILETTSPHVVSASYMKVFHQAPKRMGGDAALLVLIDIGEQPHRR